MPKPTVIPDKALSRRFSQAFFATFIVLHLVMAGALWSARALIENLPGQPLAWVLLVLVPLLFLLIATLTAKAAIAGAHTFDQMFRPAVGFATLDLAAPLYCLLWVASGFLIATRLDQPDSVVIALTPVGVAVLLFAWGAFRSLRLS